jgi:hypothetical protein
MNQKLEKIERDIKNAHQRINVSVRKYHTH